MDTVTSRDGTGIAFDRFGEGPAVILVGGALHHRAFDPRPAELAAILAERFSVFNYDRRGRGDSGDTPSYAVERELEDLDALIEEAGGSAFLLRQLLRRQPRARGSPPRPAAAGAIGPVLVDFFGS
jgi:pimeloyl-ACP methyl ester carboxylesterase